MVMYSWYELYASWVCIINCLNNLITNFPNNVLVNVTPEYQCSNFDKTLAIGEIIRLTTEDNFKYLMVELLDILSYLGKRCYLPWEWEFPRRHIPSTLAAT